MPVTFYYHTAVENLGERGALFEVARQLLDRYGGTDAPHMALIANVVPDHVPAWRPYELTQLDALLLGETFVAILDFKSVARPLLGGENTRWAIVKSDGRREHVFGGNSTNPYHQLKNARNRWTQFFREETKPFLAAGDASPFDWNKLSGRIVFYPALHPQSQLFDPPIWLRFLSAKDVAADAVANAAGFRLTPALIRALAEDVLQVQVWELTRTIRHQLGALAVLRPDRLPLTTHPVYAHSQLALGRYSDNDIVIDASYKRTSRRHARIVAGADTVRLYDEGSLHGTFVGSRRVAEDGLPLEFGVTIQLGRGETEEQARQVATVMFLRPDPPQSTSKTYNE